MGIDDKWKIRIVVSFTSNGNLLFLQLMFEKSKENFFPKTMEDWHHVWIEFSTLHTLVTIGLNLKPPNSSICAKTFNALRWKIGGKFEFAEP